MSKALPPFWFVGLHEALAGSVVDTLPRTRPPRFLNLDVAERDATDLYRSLWPLYHELALVGIAALVIASVLAAAACMWNGRKLPVATGRRAPEDGAAGLAWKWTMAHVVARTSSVKRDSFSRCRRCRDRSPIVSRWHRHWPLASR